MRTKKVYWFGLVFVLSSVLVACSGTTPTPQAEKPKSAESVVTVEPTAESVATEEPTTENVASEQVKVPGLPLGEIAPDFTLPTGDGNMVNLAEELQENQQVVLVFYIGSHVLHA